MNRRSFLKLSGLTGISMLVPVNFIVDNCDDETRFFQYIAETYDEVAVTQLIKTYGIALRKKNNEPLIVTLNGIVNRQPEVFTWLRTRIKFEKVPGEERKRCTNPRYAAITSHTAEHVEYWGQWYLWSKKEYAGLTKRFNLPEDS